MKNTWLFSGQGSQYKNMGLELYRNNKVFKKYMDLGDEIAGKHLKVSLVKGLYETGESAFIERTLYSHPLILILEYSLAQVLINEDVMPDILVGYSIGEYAANIFAGILTFKEALNLLIIQAELLEQNCQEAGMLAILANKEIYSDSRFFEFKKTVLAAENFDEHFVVTGSKPVLDKLSNTLKTEHIASLLLPISHGFHSDLIDKIKYIFIDKVKGYKGKKPNKKIYSCAYGGELEELSETYFWDVVRNQVQFYDTITTIEDNENVFYMDVGPAGTLATFVKHLLKKENKSIAVMNQFGKDQAQLEKSICFYKNKKENSNLSL